MSWHDKLMQVKEWINNLGFLGYLFSGLVFMQSVRRLRVHPRITKVISYRPRVNDNGNLLGMDKDRDMIMIELIVANNSTRALPIMNIILSQEPESIVNGSNVKMKSEVRLPVIPPNGKDTVAVLFYPQNTKRLVITFKTSRYNKKIILKCP